MSYMTGEVIKDINEKSTNAYDKIEEAVRELRSIGVSESAITLSVRVLYRDIDEEVFEE